MADKKVKKNHLSLEQKVQIIQQLERGVKAKRVAENFGVSEPAISYIKKNKASILAAVADSVHDVKKKTLHKPQNEEMENQLYKWFEFQRSKNCPLSADLIKSKAREIYRKLNPEKDESAFVASNGWFERFKRRHGIRFLSISGEKVSADLTSITPFIHRLRAKMEELEITEDQLYNGDESALYYRLLPKRTFVAANEKSAAGRKTAKERVSFMLCANAAGTHKLKALVIGKSKNPRCFKGFKNPLLYSNSKKSWMTRHIFRDWFYNDFVKEVCLCDYLFEILFIYVCVFMHCCHFLFYLFEGSSIRKGK